MTRAGVLRIVFWLSSAAWAALIFAISSVPAGDLPPGRYGFAGHLIGYLVLGALLYLALRVDSARVRSALIAVALASAYGASDEYHQSFVPGRTPSVGDWVVDTTGAMLGVGIMLLAERVFSRSRDQ